MNTFRHTLGSAVAVLGTIQWVAAGALPWNPPPETGFFKPGPGADLANGQCLVCHSVEYVTTQPPMPRAFWKASIDKMRAKYGAGIPDDQVAPILDYIVAEYGKHDASPSTNSIAAPTAEATVKTAISPQARAHSLMVRRGCFNCHLVDKKLVGPSYRDVAAKYEGKTEARTRIRHQIKAGGSGQWGAAPMPPFPGFTEEEIALVTDWVLSAK